MTAAAAALPTSIFQTWGAIPSMTLFSIDPGLGQALSSNSTQTTEIWQMIQSFIEVFEGENGMTYGATIMDYSDLNKLMSPIHSTLTNITLWRK